MNPSGYNFHQTGVGNPTGAAAAANNNMKAQQESQQESQQEPHEVVQSSSFMPRYAVLGPGGVVTSATLRDVLNGRGQGVQRHPGNAKYRTLVFVNKVSFIVLYDTIVVGWLDGDDPHSCHRIGIDHRRGPIIPWDVPFF